MQQPDLLTHPITLLIVAAVLGLISTGAVAAVRYSRRVVATLDKLDERVLPHFAPATPGVADQSLPARVEHIAAELTIDHGESVKDAVDDTRELARSTRNMVEDHDRRLSRLESRRTNEGA